MPTYVFSLPAAIRRAHEEGRLLAPEEVAGALSVSRRRVYALEYSGRLPGVRVGRLLRFHPENVAALLGVVPDDE